MSNQITGGRSDSTGAIQCPDGYNYFGTSCLTNDTMGPGIVMQTAFPTAKSACGVDNMVYLPKNREQNIAFREAIKHEYNNTVPHMVWVGVELSQGEWKTVTGAPLSTLQADWAKDEPSNTGCLLYTSPSPRDRQKSRMPSSA